MLFCNRVTSEKSIWMCLFSYGQYSAIFYSYRGDIQQTYCYYEVSLSKLQVSIEYLTAWPSTLLFGTQHMVTIASLVQESPVRPWPLTSKQWAARLCPHTLCLSLCSNSGHGSFWDVTSLVSCRTVDTGEPDGGCGDVPDLHFYRSGAEGRYFNPLCSSDAEHNG